MEAQTRRKLQDGAAYDALITPADAGDRLIAKQAGVPDTLALVQRVASQYRGEVAKLADKLALRLKGVGPTGTGPDLRATCRAIWQFVYQHIQYHLDEPGLEQVRHPARSWADRVRGVDCEDYAVFISALLQNLGIPHLLRISAYKGGWQHIYVLVPLGQRLPAADPDAVAQLPTGVFTEDYRKSSPDKPHLKRADYITLDCVTDEFDYEVTPSKTMNLCMTELRELSGFGLGLAAAETAGEFATDGQLVATYPSKSGHTIGIGDLGGVYVRDDGDLGELGALGAIGRFKPLPQARRALKAKGRKISRKPKRGGLITKLVGAGGQFRNPAEIPGATDIAAVWKTESNHLAGIDHLGGLYVMDTNDQLERLGQLSGLDVNDPELAGWLKNAFKKVGNVYATVGKGIAKGVSAAASGVAQGVQKGIFDQVNKIPGVKYLADNYGMEILQTAAGIGLSAITGGAAAPALLAVKAAKAGSIAAKIAKAAALAKKAKTAISAASKLKNVAKAISIGKKAVKVVKVAKKVTALLPRHAETAGAQTLSENPQPLSFLPADASQVQNVAQFVPNLVQQVEVPAYAAPAVGPTIPLSPDTAAVPANGLAVRPTASVVAPAAPVADDSGTYATEVSDEAEPELVEEEVADEAAEPMGELGELGLSTPAVLVAGGVVLAVGVAAILLGGHKSTAAPRRQGLAGTPRRRPSATTKTNRRPAKKAAKKPASKAGPVRKIRL